MLKIANTYGNVDIRGGLPGGYAHVSGKYLGPLCRKLGIKYAPAMIGFDPRHLRHRPLMDGVVVSKRSEKTLLLAIAERETRRRNYDPAKARQRKQARDTRKFATQIRAMYPSMPEDDVQQCAHRATMIGSGRVGRSSQVDQWDAADLAVYAYARHSYTEYDFLFEDGCDKDEAREIVRSRVREIVGQWRGIKMD